MYIDNNKVYSDAGKYLICGSAVGFHFKAYDSVTELEINIDDLHIVGNRALYNNDQFTQIINPKYTYGDYKSAIIKKRYSNDDQIAIILNADDSTEDKVKFQRMNSWRDFAAKLAHKIIEALE